eukprot:TRINITY_DN1683_c0_g1_i1.p1 TRINITY_DN1683_c0_g1~~TRINITY_DN1683_c0_g1_i1.p1  ORF type:complete len:116 (+),score=35.25 TRINITY_DN1683_c0_g1_i1:74-421(+)
MDIDLLWTLGGWLLVPELKHCMAAEEISARTHAFFLCFFILILLAHPTDQLKITMASFSARRLLSPTTSQSMNLNPKTTPPSFSSSSSSSSSSSASQFKASAHEVPSGPNPISNK